MDEIFSDPNPAAPHPLAFSVLRVPYFLEPDYDESLLFIESNRDRLVKKWGGNAGWESQKLRHDLKGRGLEAGIPHFNLDRLTGNTMASHRLIQYVGKRYGLNASEALYDALNVYYFVDGHSLNDRPRLAKMAHGCLTKTLPDFKIMSSQEILKFLEGNEGRREIETALSTLHQLGIHGIPKFIIEGARVVDGAAHSNVFVKIFREIEARGSVENGGRPIFGEILGVSPEVVERGSHLPRKVDDIVA